MKSLKRYFNNYPFAIVTTFCVFFILVFMIIMNSYFPQKPIGDFSSLIVAYEFAESVNDIQIVFQDLSVDEIKMIDVGNYFDFGFMITYALLLGFLFIKSSKVFHKKWMLIGIPLSLIILLGDFSENLLLLKISGIYNNSANNNELISLLEKLHFITWLKWGGLAFSFFIFYAIFYPLNWFYKIAGLVCTFPLLYILTAGEFTPGKISVFTSSIFASFFVLIIFGLSFKKT